MFAFGSGGVESRGSLCVTEAPLVVLSLCFYIYCLDTRAVAYWDLAISALLFTVTRISKLDFYLVYF